MVRDGTSTRVKRAGLMLRTAKRLEAVQRRWTTNAVKTRDLTPAVVTEEWVALASDIACAAASPPAADVQSVEVRHHYRHYQMTSGDASGVMSAGGAVGAAGVVSDAVAADAVLTAVRIGV